MNMGRNISAFIITMSLLTIISMPVLAATEIQDGLEVTYTTNQESYEGEDTLIATLNVSNTSDIAIENVELEITIPSGYTLENGEVSASFDELEAEEEIQLIVSFIKTAEDVVLDIVPDTADTSSVILYMSLFIGASILLVIGVKQNRKGKKIISILLCMAMVSVVLPTLEVDAESEEKEIIITQVVEVDSEEIALVATISYQMETEKSTEVDTEENTDADTEENTEVDTEESTDVDTDGDGLSDEIENMITFTDPTLADTDGDGVLDGDEDFDEDGLTNLEEIVAGTDCWMADSDLDGLTDKEELQTYNTNPMRADTDEDGMSDGNEITYGTEPNNPDSDGDGILDGDEIYEVIIKINEEEADENVELYVTMQLLGSNLGTVSIANVGTGNPYLEYIQDMPSYMGMPYSVTSSESFDSATITFQYDASFLADANFEPVIYCFNTTTKLLEKVENQSNDTSTCSVSAEVTSFGTYILVDASKIVADSVPDNTSVDKTTDTDNDGLPDYYEKLGLTINGITYNTDYQVADTDGDGLLDGEEVKIVDDKFVIITNPLKADSDKDGIDDKTDPDPMIYSITDHTLALAAGLSYVNLSTEIGNTVGSITSLPDADDYAELVSFGELSDFQILWGNDSEQISMAEYFDRGYGSIAIKISREGQNDAIIYAIRGSDFDVDFVTDGLTDVALALGLETKQSAMAFIEYKVLVSQYPNCDIYLTGHSLGGRLVQDVVYNVYTTNSESAKTDQIVTPTHAATFNGLGYNLVQYLELNTNSLITTAKINSVLYNYYNTDDLIGEGLGDSNLFKRLGTEAGDFTALDEKGDAIVRAFPELEYEPGNFHGILTFYEQEELKYPNSDIY